MSITEAAQAEADERWPANHVVDDPFGETGYAYSDEYGYDETANRAFVQGAEWAAANIAKGADA